MGVKSIESLKEFHEIIKSEKPVVIDFWAQWCGPCKTISQDFENLSNQSEGVEFYKVDIDKQDQVAEEVGIRAIPSFILFQNGNKVDSFTGAQRQGIEALVQRARESLI